MFNKLKNVFGDKSEKEAAQAGTTAARAQEVKTRGADLNAAATDAAKAALPKKEKVEVLTDEQKANSMAPLYTAMKIPPVIGDLVEGPVIALDKASVYVDLAPFGTGIIYGREFIIARDVIKKINIGDVIAAKIVDNTHKEGYFELSLKEARQALIWSEAEAAIKEKKVLDLPVKEANKGGLLIEWQGIVGFLPASQLKAEHYPRVSDGDKDKILDELKKLVGQRLPVSIITADRYGW